MLIRIGKFILLIQFGLATIGYYSSCKKLSNRTGNYSFKYTDPLKVADVSFSDNEVVDSSCMIPQDVENNHKEPKKIKIKPVEAVMPNELEIEKDSVAPDTLPPEPKSHKIKIVKHDN